MMRTIRRAVLATSTVLFVACAGTNPVKTEVAETTRVSEHKAVLFVSMDDGSVVRQEIDSTADYCFKANASTETTCLTIGEPILDPATNKVIAHQMLERQLQLHAAN